MKSLLHSRALSSNCFSNLAKKPLFNNMRSQCAPSPFSLNWIRSVSTCFWKLKSNHQDLWPKVLILFLPTLALSFVIYILFFTLCREHYQPFMLLIARHPLFLCIRTGRSILYHIKRLSAFLWYISFIQDKSYIDRKPPLIFLVVRWHCFQVFLSGSSNYSLEIEILIQFTENAVKNPVKNHFFKNKQIFTKNYWRSEVCREVNINYYNK